jgi:hypothetical protein
MKNNSSEGIQAYKKISGNKHVGKLHRMYVWGTWGTKFMPGSDHAAFVVDVPQRQAFLSFFFELASWLGLSVSTLNAAVGKLHQKKNKNRKSQ